VEEFHHLLLDGQFDPFPHVGQVEADVQVGAVFDDVHHGGREVLLFVHPAVLLVLFEAVLAEQRVVLGFAAGLSADELDGFVVQEAGIDLHLLR
jgi:hypothetical protein